MTLIQRHNIIIARKRRETLSKRRLRGVKNALEVGHRLHLPHRRTLLDHSGDPHEGLYDYIKLRCEVWLWALLQHTYFPGLGIKNGLCIVPRPRLGPEIGSPLTPEASSELSSILSGRS